ncbi:twin-arginine translocase subunit TatC [Opitutus sp. GAS368]|uniref:twin-arginine translocase subunit TatC n=1 Tax=Opitutus sp. GAS368 TaxID=1882749 RepID=UPI000879C431|nr:twin-arginine translocase subunit TatC [Opitutus sp. GAS368]SDR69799.1 sec-independent protein translocase protein TatC [Opitutus sp. GAS368]
MADETIDVEPAPAAHKSFLGHLEDLRQVLIRSLIAVGVALLLCLTFVDRLVAIVEYPLRNIDLFEKPQPTVSFEIGSTRLGPYTVTREQFAGLPAGAAPHVVFQVGTAKVGPQQVAALRLLPDAPGADVSPLHVRLHNFGPAEGFFIAFHVALYGALILSAPFWMYFIGSFIMPALKQTERQAIFPWVGWSLFLFLAGVLSTYFVLLPVALRASVAYSDLLGFEGLDWRAEDYISFVTHFIFGMGLGFQFPIVVLFLVKLGYLTHAQLAKYRRHVCVASFILGAVLTTPEVITQVAMAIPLYLLYEICIWIAWYWERKQRGALAAPA